MARIYNARCPREQLDKRLARDKIDPAQADVYPATVTYRRLTSHWGHSNYALKVWAVNLKSQGLAIYKLRRDGRLERENFTSLADQARVSADLSED